MQRERELLLAKIETVYGTDSVPTPEANAILAHKNMEFSVIGKRLDRDHALQFMGSHPPMNIGEGLKIKFTVDIRGKGGASDVPPEYGVLMRCCNFTETIDPGVNVEYELNSSMGIPDSQESCSIYYYMDRKFHKLLGCRGDLEEAGESGVYGKKTFTMQGIYAGVARVGAIPAGTFNTTMPPRFVSANFLIDGFAGVLKTVKVALGNMIAKRDSANAATGILEWMIGGRAPKFDCDPEVPEITQAALSTDLAGDNNDLVFTAHEDYPGVDGNDITVEYADTGVAGAETCVVTALAILIGIEAGVSTAAQVKTKIEATPAAMALLASVTHKAGNDGSGVVPVMAATNLAGGAGIEFWDRWENSTGMDVSYQYGNTAGNTCSVALKGAVLDVPGYSAREKLATFNLPSTLHPSATGNDEVKYTYS